MIEPMKPIPTESERKAKADEILAGAPESMTLRDPDGWETTKSVNADDPNGIATLAYAERWARMMEARMARGDRIEDMAAECSHLADEDHVTGFMQGKATGLLGLYWKHGEELMAWHERHSRIFQGPFSSLH